MPEYSIIIGGAGTGKTTRLMDLLTQVLQRGVPVERVAFLSFTRAARREAVSRAADLTGCTEDDLALDGWFRTVHSICHKLLDVSRGELLTDDGESRRWLTEVTGEEFARDDGEEDAADPFTGHTIGEQVLAMWNAARNRMVPFREVHDLHITVNNRTENLDRCLDIIHLYEQAKRLHNKMDFTDMLCMVAGVSVTTKGAQRVEPEGEVPMLDVAFLDEQQDCTALQFEVLQRLTEHSRWVYIVGDPFQGVYGWAGADPHLMMNWKAPDNRRGVLDKSYRCPAPVLEFGESVLSECSDYWNRKIQPADHDGSIEASRDWTSFRTDINPNESWMMIARTRRVASKITARLDGLGIPWVPTQGHGGWDAPVRMKALGALHALADGSPITGDEWAAICSKLPWRRQGVALFVRGTKKRWKDMERAEQINHIGDTTIIEQWGATPKLIEMITTGRWLPLIKQAEDYVEARKMWGYEACHNPRLRIGTFHSVKGEEADNVVVMSEASDQIRRAYRYSEETSDEERRLLYVAITRARQRLIVSHSPSNPTFVLPLKP